MVPSELNSACSRNLVAPALSVETANPGVAATAAELLPLFMRDLSSLQTENLAKWFDAESKLCLPPCVPTVGQRRILTVFGLIFRRYSELSWSVRAVYPVGERKLIYETDSWGTFADGRPYKNDILTVIEFTPSGKIRLLSDYFKDTAIFGKT